MRSTKEKLAGWQASAETKPSEAVNRASTRGVFVCTVALLAAMVGDALVGVAYTNRLPNFSITSQTATQALSLGGLFGPGTLLSVLIGQVAAMFYDHGTLKHREAAAVAAYDQAAAQYTGAVLSGFEDVADTLAALATDADGMRAAVKSERAADHALRILREQQNVGAVSTPAVLNAEQTYERAELTLVQAQAARYADTAALFATLGGGWWNRRETTPQK
jgi:outer membrane protein TolC